MWALTIYICSCIVQQATTSIFNSFVVSHSHFSPRKRLNRNGVAIRFLVNCWNSFDHFARYHAIIFSEFDRRTTTINRFIMTFRWAFSLLPNGIRKRKPKRNTFVSWESEWVYCVCDVRKALSVRLYSASISKFIFCSFSVRSGNKTYICARVDFVFGVVHFSKKKKFLPEKKSFHFRFINFNIKCIIIINVLCMFCWCSVATTKYLWNVYDSTLEPNVESPNISNLMCYNMSARARASNRISTLYPVYRIPFPSDK